MSFWRHCANPHILFTSVKTALVVGSVLALINHFEAILTRQFTPLQKMKIAITYLVPFSVATYAAAKHAARLARPFPPTGSAAHQVETGPPAP